MPRALVVNSGSKILAAQLRRDAGPVVLDVEPHVRVRDAAADADGAAASVERLDGVDQQVEEDLADLDGVDADPRQVGRARRRAATTPGGTVRRACCAATTSATRDDVAARRPDAREVEQVADDLLGQADLRAQDAEILLHVGRRVRLDHLEVVDGVGHHAERVAQLVADAAGELAEHRQLLAADQLLLRVVQLRHRLLELGGARLDARCRAASSRPGPGRPWR